MPPNPPPQERQWPLLGADALQGPAGEVVAKLEPHCEGDPAGLLLCYLLGFGCMVGAGPHVLLGATPHPARLFGVMVGSTSSSRKGSTFDLVRTIFDSIDKDFIRLNSRSNIGSPEGIIKAAADLERVSQARGRADTRLWIIEPEFASFLDPHIIRRASTLVRDAWDRGRLATTTKRPILVESAHVCLLGMITPDELAIRLQRSQMTNGFANRFLFVMVKKSKTLALDELGTSAHVLRGLADVTKDALDFAADMRAIQVDDDVVRAHKRWRELHEKEEEGLLDKLLGRGPSYLLRLALIYALLDQSSSITMSHFHAALAFWSYCEDSVRYLFNQPRRSTLAEKAYLALIKAGPAGMTRKELDRVFPNRYDHLREALKELDGEGLLTFVTEPTRGRPRQVTRLRAFDEGRLEEVEIGEESPTRPPVAPTDAHSPTDIPIGETAIDGLGPDGNDLDPGLWPDGTIDKLPSLYLVNEGDSDGRSVHKSSSTD